MRTNCLPVCLFLITCGLCIPSPVFAQSAESLLRESGVKGGLVVHLGCGTAKLTGDLAANDSFLVHGLDADAGNIRTARDHLRSRNLYGRASVEQFADANLPYIDNTVRLLVVEDAGEINRQEMMRVLTPEGVLMVKEGNEWRKSIKPWPNTIDEWTHVLYNAAGNMVSSDREVDSPFHTQWMAGPTWNRQVKTSAFVTSAGRVFSIHSTQHGAVKPWNMSLGPDTDEEWAILARDAFSGVLLWQRRLKSWGGGGPKKTGPADIGRRLVVVGECTYVTLGHDQPLSFLDAATGHTRIEVANSRGTEEVIVLKDMALLLVAPNPPAQPQISRITRENRGGRRIMAVHAQTGKRIWSVDDLTVLNACVTATEDHIFYHFADGIAALDRSTGKQVWKQSISGPANDYEKSGSGKIFFGDAAFAPKMVAHGDHLLCSFSGTITALDATTGKKLWEQKGPLSNYRTAPDMLIKDDLIWLPGLLSKGTQACVKLDLKTGRDLTYRPNTLSKFIAHHLCSPVHATDKYLVFSSTGIELQDFDNPGNFREHVWARSSCYSGVLPANGMLYIAPHNCACFIQGKLTGYVAMAPRSESFSLQLTPRKPSEIGFEKGPASGQVEAGSGGEDWPTFRGNNMRSGQAATALPASLAKAWTTRIGGRLSQPVIGEGKVILASIDAQTVHCLDEANGKDVWHYFANGRVDSPPTIYKGHVLFGSADGWLHCLRATDGALVWRLRAAVAERRLVCDGRLESAWPVQGSVLVWDDVVYCLAGRSSSLDGGMRLMRIDCRTGNVLTDNALYSRKSESDPNSPWQTADEQFTSTLQDILSSDGKYLYLQNTVFSRKGKQLGVALSGEKSQGKNKAQNAKELGSRRLIAAAGYLDDSWWKRVPWVYATRHPSVHATGAGSSPKASRLYPSGTILVHDQDSVYGWGGNWMHVNHPERGFKEPHGYRVFCADKAPLDGAAAAAAAKERAGETMRIIKADGGRVPDEKTLRRVTPTALPTDYRWSETIDGQVWALCVAGNTLAFAGAQGEVSEVTAERLVSDKSPALWLADKRTGEPHCNVELHSAPVWDGMAAARGKIFIAHRDGSISCFGDNRMER